MEPFIHINEELIDKFCKDHPDISTKAAIIQKLFEMVYDDGLDISFYDKVVPTHNMSFGNSTIPDNVVPGSIRTLNTVGDNTHNNMEWKIAIAKSTMEMGLINKDGTFTNMVFSAQELKDFISMIIVNSQVYISCPVKIDDTVWLIDKGDTNKPEIIECTIKIIRHIQTDNTSTPSFEALVEAKDENVHIRGYDENVMSMISMNGNYSTWVNKFMYEKYWFLSEEEAKKALSSMKK